MKTASEAADHLNVLISVPRQVSRQAHRQNYGIQSPEEYYRVAIYVPYLDSLTASLARRFSESNAKSFKLLQLHPAKMKCLSSVEFHAIAEDLQGFYGIENFKEEGISWYEMWRNKTGDPSQITYAELLLQAKPFFPAVAKAIEVALALPVTTCTVERSFSTMRRLSPSVGKYSSCTGTGGRTASQGAPRILDQPSPHFGSQPPSSFPTHAAAGLRYAAAQA
ncbi:hypothetical protein HPB50_007959 [Hyalomma asiaticum]|uniref:Uncharacterized protein n=1 Tax=Hyalomma asiaticum TaxID=266040 RepID=A0ACB7S563_HYAAI|nr:hypothetical protein HPB50_007959 [Hyalomma asiaticum]